MTLLRGPLPAWKRNLAVLWLANFLTSAGLMALLPFFAPYVRDLGVKDPAACELWAGFIVGSGPFMAAAMSGFWGAIGDRLGRKRMVLRALCAITVFVGAMGFATAPWQLLVLRLLQGTFSGYVAPTLTLVSVLAPVDRQGRIGGRLQTSVLAGAVVGPWLSSLVVPLVGYAGISFLCALSSIASAGLVYLFVIEPPRVDPAVLRPHVGLRALIVDASRDLWRAVQKPELKWLLIALFLVRCASAAVNPTLVTHVEEMLADTSSAAHEIASRVFSAQPLATLLFLPVFGRMSDLFGARRILLFCVGGGALATFAQAFTAAPWSLGVGRFVAGAFLAGVFPAAVTATARGSSTERRGGELGLTFAALTFGLALGPMLGSVVDAVFDYRTLLLASAVCLCGAFAMVVVHGGVATRTK